jgi:hypothetical protein
MKRLWKTDSQTATYKTFKNAILKGETLDLPIAKYSTIAIKDLGTGTWRKPFTH